MDNNTLTPSEYMSRYNYQKHLQNADENTFVNADPYPSDKFNYDEQIHDEELMAFVMKDLEEKDPYKRATPEDIKYGYIADEIEIFDEHGLLDYFFCGKLLIRNKRPPEVVSNSLSIYYDGLLCYSIVEGNLMLNRIKNLLIP